MLTAARPWEGGQGIPEEGRRAVWLIPANDLEGVRGNEAKKVRGIDLLG